MTSAARSHRCLIKALVLSVAFLNTECVSFSDPSPLANSDKTAAVIGDSISTGAVTHPALGFDSGDLWKVYRDQADIRPLKEHLPNPEVFGIQEDPISAPLTMWPSAREFTGGFAWVHDFFVIAQSYLHSNTEEYSWGYLAARALGIPARSIYIAAQNGARMEAGYKQVDRVLEHTNGILPHFVFMFFTGNDLCGPTLNYITEPTTFELHLKRTFDYMIRNSRPPDDGGTDVILLSYLGVLQLVDNPSILTKKVRAHGTRLTCQELAAYKAKTWDLTSSEAKSSWEANLVFNILNFPQSPANFCPTLFSTNLDFQKDNKQLTRIANRIRSYREASKHQSDKANEKAQAASKNIRFHFVEGTADFQLSGDDVANDCFHLSTQGQHTVAKITLDYLNKSGVRL